MRSAGSPTPTRSGSTPVTCRDSHPRATAPVGHLAALWRRVVAALIVGDPDPRYSALDRLDGRRTTGADQAIGRIHAPVDGESQ